MSDLPLYQSHKKVRAAPIDHIEKSLAEPEKHIIFLEGYGLEVVNSKMFARYTPVRGDYYVVYDDGYASISPRKAFEDGYIKIEESA